MSFCDDFCMSIAQKYVQQPPRLHELAVAVVHSLKLRGALVSCGQHYRAASWPDSPAVRVASIQPPGSSHAAISHITAAWVWGATRKATLPLQFTMHSARRAPRFNDELAEWHQFTFAEEDLVRFGHQYVTTPERTVFDLLHQQQAFASREIIACRLLLMHPSTQRERLRHTVLTERRPFCNIARTRLRLLGH